MRADASKPTASTTACHGARSTLSQAWHHGVTRRSAWALTVSTVALITAAAFPSVAAAASAGASLANGARTVTPAGPMFTSAASTTFTTGTAGTFTVVAVGSPIPTLSKTAGSLPSGVMFNATTGVLSGVAAQGTAGTYPITFTATNGVPTDATQSFVLTVLALTGYTPLNPVRICDTRAGMAANPCQKSGGAAGTLGAGGVVNVKVSGVSGVPATAVAVTLNVTVTNTTAQSFLTVWPKDVAQRPTASNLNWPAGVTVPNLVTVAVGPSGMVSVFNSAGSADVVIDLEGYFDNAAPSLFNPLSPARICDTRGANPNVAVNQCELSGGVGSPLVGSLPVTVAGMAGVPADATAVVLNVTVTNTTTSGFLTVYPDGGATPLASNLNWAAGQTVPNRVMVKLGLGGRIRVFNSAGATDVIVDVNGYFSSAPGGSGFRPGVPTRVCDTRVSAPKNACNDPATVTPGPLGENQEFTLIGPGGESAVIFNVTVVDTTGSSYLTVFPDPTPNMPVTPPVISDLNWSPGQIVPNLVVVGTGPAAAIAFYNKIGSTDLVIDFEADFSTTPSAPTGAAAAAPASVSVARTHVQSSP